jgi:hypothetical protein
MIVDAYRCSITTLDLDGSPLSEVFVPGFRLITAAHQLGDTWILLARNDANQELLLRIITGSTTVVDTVLAALDDLPPYMRRLSGDDTLAVVSDVRFPFSVQGITAMGDLTIRVSTQSPSVMAAAVEASDSSRWIAMPYLPIDSVLLHTRADMTSDQRVHSLVRIDGTVVRASSTNVPLAFIAHNSSIRQVVAARRLNSLELVWYVWRWGAKLKRSESAR